MCNGTVVVSHLIDPIRERVRENVYSFTGDNQLNVRKALASNLDYNVGHMPLQTLHAVDLPPLLIVRIVFEPFIFLDEICTGYIGSLPAIHSLDNLFKFFRERRVFKFAGEPGIFCRCVSKVMTA